MSLFKNRFLLALATLVGTMVGAGIFGMPYVLVQSGAVLFLGAFALVAGAVWLLHLLVGEVALRTRESHRLIGYGSIYLGSRGKLFFTFTTVFGIVGALLAYVVVGGAFLHGLAAPFFPFSPVAASLAFWALLSPFILRGIRAISKMELLMNLALLVAVGFVASAALPEVVPSRIPLAGAEPLSPFGVLLFAFVGWAAIPELADLFKGAKDRKNLDNVIAWAMGISALLYAVFAFAVAGVVGRETSQDALSSLAPFVGEGVVAAGAAFGLLAVAASYLVLGNYLKNSLRHDFGMPYALAAAIAVFSPAVLFLLGAREFVPVLALVGGVALSLEGIGVVVLWRRARALGERAPEFRVKMPPAILWAAVLLLGLAAAAELLNAV